MARAIDPALVEVLQVAVAAVLEPYLVGDPDHG
jgi:hypothetical protein